MHARQDDCLPMAAQTLAATFAFGIVLLRLPTKYLRVFQMRMDCADKDAANQNFAHKKIQRIRQRQL